jgi:hypothetical protein
MKASELLLEIQQESAKVAQMGELFHEMAR